MSTSGRTRRGLLVGGDAIAIADVIQVEDALVVAYRQALRSRTLGPRAARVVHSVYEHELAHLRALGAPVPAGPAALSAAAKLLAAHNVSESLTGLHDERTCLRLLLAVEAVAEGAYFKAMSKLESVRLLRLGAEIMASEAQHATLLTELLHPGDITRAVPDPFVVGTS